MYPCFACSYSFDIARRRWYQLEVKEKDTSSAGLTSEQRRAKRKIARAGIDSGVDSVELARLRCITIFGRVVDCVSTSGFGSSSFVCLLWGRLVRGTPRFRLNLSISWKVS